MSYLDKLETSRYCPNRIIIGTCVDLRKHVSNGSFRDDLYFFLSSAYLSVPPLRDRLEDVKLLANLICQRLSDEFGINKTLQTEAVDRLQDWNWPGYLRELILAHKMKMVL